MKKVRFLMTMLIVFLISSSMFGCSMADRILSESIKYLDEQNEAGETILFDEDSDRVDESKQNMVYEENHYTSKDEVALYIHTFGKLPGNYIKKADAQNKGWKSGSNTIDQVLPGMSIGGDYFGNYEELLPKENGRSYYECDIDYEKGARNAKRIVFSSDGLIFYTDDHYKSFEQLY